MPKEFDFAKLRGSDNFHTWSFAIQKYLTFKGYGNTIKRITIAATSTTPATTSCAESDSDKCEKANAILALGVDESIYVHINKCTTALQTWECLQKLYEEKGLTRKIALLRGLIQTRLDECDGMQSYIDQIMTTSNKLTGIGFEIQDEWLGAILLAGLTDEYMPLILGIEGIGQSIASERIVSKLLDSNMNKAQSAFLSKKGNKNVHAKGKKNNKFRKQRKCFVCKSEQHLMNECPERQSSSKENEKRNNEKKSVAFIGHIGLLSLCKKNEWFIDSGASSHMSPYNDIIHETKKAEVDDITTADDTSLKVEYAGKTKLDLKDKTIELNDVLHIPNMSANLLSVYKIVSKGNIVVFDANGCRILDGNKRLIYSCKPQNGVYKLISHTEKCMLANTNNQSLVTWHRRFGHVSYHTLSKLQASVTGLAIQGDKKDIQKCEICPLGKQHRVPFKTSETRAAKILQLIHSDLCGPMEKKSIGRARYMLTFSDDFSRKLFVYFLAEKSKVLDTFIEFKKLIENQTDEKIKILRTDNGTEYVSKRFEEVLKRSGIQHQMTCTYTPQQNGVSERANRTIVERARCMIFDANLDTKFWAEACSMAAYLMNRTPRALLGNRTPEEKWGGVKPDVSGLKIFGSKVMVHTPREKRTKWQAKSNQMIFVGFDDNKKGFRCFDDETKKVIVSRDVIFFESSISTVKADLSDELLSSVNHELAYNAEDDTDDENLADMPNDEFNTPNTSNAEQSTNRTVNINGSSNETSNGGVDSDGDDAEVTIRGENTQDEDVENDDANDATFNTRARIMATSTPRVSSRDKRQVRPFQITHLALLSTEPQTYKDANDAEDAKFWREAMREEMNSHASNDTWTLAPLPPNRKAIGARWIFKIKIDGNSGAKRYKARLVAKGFGQKEGIDFTETFSPVVRLNTIRILMALAVQNGMKIHQMDAITAFLQGDVEEELYMQQPIGFNDDSGNVCRLNKAIYGLRQAGRQWNKKLDAFLLQIGYKRSSSDPCVYIKRNLIIAIYVDDFLIFYLNLEELNTIRDQLHGKFSMKDVGAAKYCLGITINQMNDCIELDQSHYINNVFKQFGMSECKAAKTPSELNEKLSRQMFDEKNSLVGKVPYQEAVGCLLYMANATRPDICHATSDVSRFNNAHSEQHWIAVKRIFRYLRGTINLKLQFKKNPNKRLVSAYCDSDWGSEIDERKSRSGFVILMAGGAVSWLSKKQSIVALSSTEAEYISLSSTVRELIWIAQLLKEITGLKLCALIQCDNQSAIDLASSKAYRPRTKHIDIRHHHIRDHINHGLIELSYVKTEKQVADSLTKAVTSEKTLFCANGMGLMEN